MKKNAPHTVTLKWIDAMTRVDPLAWDRLALPLKTPFLEWHWLHQMEASGSITPGTGWLPRHLTVWSGDRLLAAAPLYIKGHSAGEFVFDHIWAEAASRLGVAYYPKLVGMSPVTPVVGYRFLIDAAVDEIELTRTMVAEIDRFGIANGLSGCSFLFADPGWADLMQGLGFNGWLHQSFSWQNQGFKTFDNYLAVFNSNQRRNIRRERRAMQAAGIDLAAFSGDDIPPGFIPLMVELYGNTNERYGPWGCKYLTPAFFEGIYRHYRRRLVFVAASGRSAGSQPLALAMLVYKKDRLFGRYWGCRQAVNALHFNTCYYSPIEWAISNGIRRFDPGAGSNHKLRRGFRAVGNTSLHRFYNPHMARIMARHMGKINALEQEQIDRLNASLPFSRTDHSR
jgi:predicted N-acyltransferase